MKPAIALWLPWSVVTLTLGWFEFCRIRILEAASPGQLRWLTEWDAEVTLPLLVLHSLPILTKVIGPYAGWKPSGLRTQSLEDNAIPEEAVGTRSAYRATARQLTTGVIVSVLVSLAASLSIGLHSVTYQGTSSQKTIRFEQLPPTYHDEFSYLLQARTFLACRWAWPEHDKSPDLFHQVHVLDQPTTASRYFPWTGMWISPWLAVGHPFWGHWFAGAVTAAMFYLSAVQLMNHRAAIGVGVLVGASPGMAIFSNLLLAHHPTIMALSFFLWAYLRLLQSRQIRFAVWSGIGLSIAMLGRPMTAAGFSLPCGLWLSVQLFNLARSETSRRTAGWIVLAYGIPLAGAFLLLAIQNDAITGNWRTSPYQLYTDTWTPRHRYGFYNVTQSPQPLTTSEVMRPYDEWATELTPIEAFRNVWKRLFASLLWTLGIAPILLGVLSLLVFGCLCCASTGLKLRGSPDLRIAIPFLSIVSMHLAHVPYWYAGILDWHYVFETCPLLILVMMAGLSVLRGIIGREIGQGRSVAWLACFIMSGLLPGWISSGGTWGESKVAMAVNTQTYSRVRMAQFEDLKESAKLERPCLILVDERGENPQLSFIINPPELDTDVLVCRLPADDAGLDELRQQFADRTFYAFDPAGFLLTKMQDE